jgi:hypothetical protein
VDFHHKEFFCGMRVLPPQIVIFVMRRRSLYSIRSVSRRDYSTDCQASREHGPCAGFSMFSKATAIRSIFLIGHGVGGESDVYFLRAQYCDCNDLLLSLLSLICSAVNELISAFQFARLTTSCLQLQRGFRTVFVRHRPHPMVSTEDLYCPKLLSGIAFIVTWAI